MLQARVADYPQVLAEGGANFWDAFSLVPVSRGFWHERVWFDVFPTRHHAPMTSFGLALRGSVVWTGDTRPIPEILAAFAAHGEVVAHDCVVSGNPSLAGIEDLHFHDLRGTGLTWMAIRGDDPLKIQQRAGHTSFEMTPEVHSDRRSGRGGHRRGVPGAAGQPAKSTQRTCESS